MQNLFQSGREKWWSKVARFGVSKKSDQGLSSAKDNSDVIQ